MMKRSTYLILVLLVFSFSSNGQTTIGTGDLKVTLDLAAGSKGQKITSIKKNETELLNTNTVSSLFSLFLRDLNTNEEVFVSSLWDWGNMDVNLSNGGANCTLIFSNHEVANVPNTLVATVTIKTDGSKSEWDLSVTGVGANHSLMDVTFPNMNILGNGGQFFIPRYAGQLIEDPATEIAYEGLYPFGHETTMQYLAYYGGGADIYFGFHDASAAIKTLSVHNEDGGVKIACKTPIPDKTLAENDWAFPGHFELDLYEGDWFPAAMIYKDWAAANASYWPADSEARQIRQAEIGKIGIWFYDDAYVGAADGNDGYARSAENIAIQAQNCIDLMGDDIVIGYHYYSAWGAPFDDNYPELDYSSIVGMKDEVEILQNQGMYVMPYFNGRMYDIDLDSWDENGSIGYHDATKLEGTDGVPVDYFWQSFVNSNGETQYFSVQCPTQPTWQLIVEDKAVEMYNELGVKGFYFDQIAGADPKECMGKGVNDPDNNEHIDANGVRHTLGGGSFWRDGYQTLLQHVYDNNDIPNNRFTTVEGGCDFILDVVDGVMVGAWDKKNMVPAYSAVYAGKVQMFGTKTYTNIYDNPSFYTQYAQTFSFGIQPGRFTTWIASDPNSEEKARPFVRNLGRMRYKLKEFMSFGEMKYPPNVTSANPIPTITSDWDGLPPDQWDDHVRNVTISQLQKSLWQKEDHIAFVFTNASMTDGLEFSFDVIGQDYGLEGDLKIRMVTADDDGTATTKDNAFTQENVTLAPMETKAFIITPATPLPISMVSFSGYKRDKKVALKWETASEVDFEGFGIERSSNGFHWEKIGFVATKGGNVFAGNNYQYLDKAPLEGMNYYRLKEQDVAGSYKYSKTISVQFEHGGITIYPNPTKGQVFIDYKGSKLDKVMIYNQLGELMLEQKQPKTVLDVSDFPKGIYVLTVQVENKLFKKMLVVE